MVLQSEDDPFQDVVGSEMDPEIQRIPEENETWEYFPCGLLSQKKCHLTRKKNSPFDGV